nr:hypothetical protein [uncultured Catonella sp.]
MENKKDYSAQIRHLRAKYVRFPLDFKPDELENFKRICKANGTTPTTEIKKFVRAYCEEHNSRG